MKILRGTILSCSENKNEKGYYRADIKYMKPKKLQNGQFIDVEEILTISSTIKLLPSEQFLRIQSEYNFQNRIFITVDESFQTLTIKKVV